MHRADTPRLEREGSTWLLLVRSVRGGHRDGGERLDGGEAPAVFCSKNRAFLRRDTHTLLELCLTRHCVGSEVDAPHTPTQPGGVGSLHANRSAAGRSNPTQAEFSGATTTKRQKTAVCFGHFAVEQESRRRTCAARRMAGPVIFPVSRKVSTRVGVRPGVFSERRRPLAAAQASCD